MSLVLGIASSHDASACLYRDGKLVAAISEERLSRIKCDGGHLPNLAIDACLKMAGAVRRDIDHIATIYGHFPDRYVNRQIRQVPAVAFDARQALLGNRGNQLAVAVQAGGCIVGRRDAKNKTQEILRE